MNMNMNTDFPEDSEDRKSTKLPSMSTSTTTSSSPSWLKLKNPRIVRVSRAFGGKDRHSKVCTVRGLRDRRIRLSVPTAIQLYDLQDRLGLNQPSKVVDWLINAAKGDIDDLPPLQMPPLSFISRNHHAPPHAQLLNINPASVDWGERSGTTFLKGKSKEEGHQVSSNNYMSSSLWEPNFGGSSTMSHGGFDHHHHVPLPAQILVYPTAAAAATTQPYFPEVVDPRQMSQFQMLMMSSAGASASSHNHHLLHNSSAHLYSARPFFTHVGAPHEDSQNDGRESEQDKNQEHFQER